MGQKRHYRPDVDGLRALAVAMVIANHIDHRLAPGGFLGVDLFFVISGFVVTGSLVGRDDPRRWGAQLVDFYARRIRRLFPSLVVCVMATMLACSLLLPEPDKLLPVGVAALFGGGNVYLYLEASDYFSRAAHDIPFTHTWSLGVEEQFYLLFPLMLLVGAKWLGERRWMIVGALSAASAVAYLLLIPVDRMAAFYLMPLRFWELGAGALLFFFSRARPSSERSPWALVGLAAVVFATVKPHGWGPWPMVATVVGTVLVVRGRGGPIFGPAIEHPCAIAIGKRSYGLYLWHWPAVVLIDRTLGIGVATGILALAITVAATELTYRWVEVPLRHADWGSSGRTLLKGLGASGATAAAGWVLATHPPFLGDPLPEIWWSGEAEPCWAGHYRPAEHDHCLTPPADAPAVPRVFVVGDSHARALQPAVRRALPGAPMHALAIAYGCSVMPDTLIPADVDERTGCSDYNDGIRRLLKAQTRPEDVVILGSFHRYVTSTEAVAPQVAHLRALADAIAPTPLILVLDAPGVPPGESGLGCQSHPWNRRRNEQRCARPAMQSREERAFHEQALRGAAAASPNAFVFEVDEHLCEGEVCSAYRGDVLLYLDGDHLSVKGAELLADPLRVTVQEAGFGPTSIAGG